MTPREWTWVAVCVGAVWAAWPLGESLRESVRIDPSLDRRRVEAIEAPIRRPQFWEIQWGDKTSYVLGTLHGGFPASKLPVDVRWKLQSSEVAFFEMDESSLSEDLTGRTAERLLLDDGSLPFMLSPIAWNTLVQRSGIPGPLLRHFSPQLAGLLLMAVETHDKSGAMDQDLRAEARAHDIPIHALDDAAFEVAQLELKTITTDDLERLLRPDTYPDVLRYVIGTIEAYKAGADPSAVELPKGLENTPADPAMARRNNAWVAKLAAELKQRSAFVAVGAAHLYGPENVLELLEKEGLVVRRL